MTQDNQNQISSSGGFFQKLLLFNKIVWINIFAFFILQFVFAGIYAVLLNIYLSRLGFGIDFIGLVNTAASLGFAAFAIPAGIFGARWGHRNMVVIGLLGGALFPALMLFSTSFKYDFQGIIIIISHGLYALSMTLLAVNGVTYLANAATDENRVHVFSVYGAIAPLAGFFGSIIYGFVPKIVADLTDTSVNQAFPYAIPLWTVPFIFIIGLVLFMFITRKEAKEQGKAAGIKETAEEKGKAPVNLFIIMFVFTVLRISSFYALFIFFSIYLDNSLKVSTELIGILTAIGRIIPAFTALFTPFLVKITGKFRLVIILCILSAVFTLPIGLFSSVIAAVISLVVVSGANAVTSSAFTTLHQEATAKEYRSLMSGSVFSAEALSSGLMAIFGGFMIKPLGYQTFFLVSVGMTIISAFIFWVLLKNKVAKT